MSEPATAAPAAAQKSRFSIRPSLALAVALCWVLVVLARGVRLALDVRAIATLRRGARAWSKAHGFPVLLSDQVHVPIAVGFAGAAVILPAKLVGELAADAVESIVVHEVAHLSRHDVWTNALARVAEAVLSFTPAAWFVVRQLSMEREIACDDWVVARTGAGDAFARTLLHLAGRIGDRIPLGAPSALGSRRSIVVRIERLLDARPRRLSLSPPALGGALMLIALVALLVQSISPVLAYAAAPAEPPAHDVAAAATRDGTCTVPNRPIRFTSFDGLKPRHRAGRQDGIALPAASTFQTVPGAANVAIFDLTVDAQGRPRAVAVRSVPPYPGMAEHVTRIMMSNTYRPALRHCVPVASTVRSALAFGAPQPNAYSIVVPAYPNGWSAQHRSACKVPTVQHTGVPTFPASMNRVPVDATYSTAVRVHVDASGSATAAIVTPSGQRAFDAAALAAARQAAYPLTEETGFKQARPSGAPLSWNTAHGSATYVDCRPLPTDYVWNTTFATAIPIAIPSTKFVVLLR